jgi:hypothetical protein
VLKLALQMMAGILRNFLDVSFYAFTHNYCNFTCLTVCSFLNKLLALFYLHFTNFIKDS